MDFTFSEDALALQEMIQKFVEKEARPLEMKYFTSGKLEDKERTRLRKVIEQMGLWGLMLPEAYGGGGLDLETNCLMEEELGKTFIPLEVGDVPPLLFACQGKQVENFLEPALAGERHVVLAIREPRAAQPADWVTHAVLQDGHYLLEGTKLLGRKPAEADFLVVFAQTEEGATTFLVDADAEGLSYHTYGDVTLHLKGCKVETGQMLGASGQGLTLEPEQAHAGWLRVAARMVGMASRLVAMAAEYANSWVALGAPLRNRPAVQRMLSEAHVQVQCVRWLVYHATWLAGQHEPMELAIAEVRLAAGEMLNRVKDLVTMIYGGPGPGQTLDPRQVMAQSALAVILAVGLDSARVFIANEIFTMHQESVP